MSFPHVRSFPQICIYISFYICLVISSAGICICIYEFIFIYSCEASILHETGDPWRVLPGNCILMCRRVRRLLTPCKSLRWRLKKHREEVWKSTWNSNRLTVPQLRSLLRRILMCEKSQSQLSVSAQCGGLKRLPASFSGFSVVLRGSGRRFWSNTYGHVRLNIGLIMVLLLIISYLFLPLVGSLHWDRLHNEASPNSLKTCDRRIPLLNWHFH